MRGCIVQGRGFVSRDLRCEGSPGPSTLYHSTQTPKPLHIQILPKSNIHKNKVKSKENSSNSTDTGCTKSYHPSESHITAREKYSGFGYRV